MRNFRYLVVAATLLASAPLAADEIVVTGKSLKQTAAELEACIQAKCPPAKDIAATLAHAENQFVGGDYKGSRTTLKTSLGRNRKHGKDHPLPVSELLRANSRIAEQLGEVRDFKFSVVDMRETLRDAYGPDNVHALIAQITVGDSRVKLGNPEEADGIYRDAEARSLKAGLNRVATIARLRRAAVMRMRHDREPSAELRRNLETKLDEIALRPLRGAEDFAISAEILRAQIDRKAGNTASTETLIRRFTQIGAAARPILLHSEPISRVKPFLDGSDGSRSKEAWKLHSSSAYGSWADVGFWIGGDGRVTEVEILRAKGTRDWLKPVTAAISKRIYAPLRKGEDVPPGFYMIERYTLTARLSDSATGTRARVREVEPRIEMIDLTPEDYSQPKKSG